MDKWAGYDFESQALMDFFQERKIPNPSVLSEDGGWKIEDGTSCMTSHFHPQSSILSAYR